MFSSLLLVTACVAAPVPEPDEKEQKALAALRAIGFRAKVSSDRTKQVQELTYSYIFPGGERLPPPTEKELANIADLPNLEKLHLPGPYTDDATLDAIRSPVLRYLDLSSSRVTDGGLKRLAGLKKLAILMISETGITDDGVKTLATFPALRVLDLRGTHVTGKGVKLLEKSGINNLGLNRTDVGDESMASLAKMSDLAVLGLEETKVTDKGLAEMTKGGAFLKLVTLNLEKTGVTDDTLKALHEPKVMPALHILYLGGTRVTGAAVDALKKSRPDLDITVER